jgi:hypothetical protein
MQIEPIDEPVAVQATHHTGRVSPELFVWRGRSYPVETVNGQWEDRDGLYRRFHFSVQASGTTFYLYLRTEDMVWMLDQVILDG